MDYAKLKPKVAELVAAYPDWTDQQIADDLNAATVSILVSIPSSELLVWSAGDDRFYRTETAANSGPKPIRSIAKAAQLMIARDNTTLDLNLPDRIAFVDALVAGEVFTAADKTSLLELATRTVSWAVSEGLGRIKVGYVQRARAGT